MHTGSERSEKGIVHTTENREGLYDSGGTTFVATNRRTIDDDDDENDEDDDEVQRRRSRLLAVYMPGEQATRQPTRKALSAETI